MHPQHDPCISAGIRHLQGAQMILSVSLCSSFYLGDLAILTTKPPASSGPGVYCCQCVNASVFSWAAWLFFQLCRLLHPGLGVPRCQCANAAVCSRESWLFSTTPPPSFEPGVPCCQRGNTCKMMRSGCHSFLY